MNKDIYDYLKKINDKNISETSLKTYTSHLNKIFYYFNDENNKFKPEFFISDVKNILKYINEKINNLSSKKTYIAAIINCIKPLNDYKTKDTYIKVMTNEAELYAQEKEKHKLNEQEKSNWVSQEEIKKIYDD